MYTGCSDEDQRSRSAVIRHLRCSEHRSDTFLPILQQVFIIILNEQLSLLFAIRSLHSRSEL